ncbi:MAG: GTP 3',8-cyclase MoaA [Firmicutes bacterium]|nr:GTP 3',8-cyclase MoaA [Bacillota bacterium]
MKDKFGRKINYLRISVTDLCNLRCRYCMPKEGVCKKKHKEILSFEDIEKIAETFVSLGIDKIRLTGGEPLVRKGILNLVKNIGKLDGLKDFAMTTNGILLEKYARDLKKAGLKRINISLDSLDDEKYSYITRGGKLEKVFRGIKKAKSVGLMPIKINTVLIGGYNDEEILDFINITKDENIDVRFIELMPIGQASKWNEERFISNEIVVNNFSELIKVKKDNSSSPAEYFKIPNSKGKVGIINPITCKFCSNCNRIRLTNEGKLKLCLHSNDEIDLKKHIKNKDKLKNIIINSIKDKPKAHNLEDGKYITKNMVQIGG